MARQSILFSDLMDAHPVLFKFIVVALGVYLIVTGLNGLRTGTVRGSFGDVDRSTSPVSYWLGVAGRFGVGIVMFNIVFYR